ncbi:MAG: ZIP family metal transporter [Candidatus Njordarchaeia archaeon]
MDPFLMFILSAIVAGLALTSLGGVPIFFVSEHVHSRKFDVGNGVAAGLMLAASIFSLLLPGIEMGGMLPVLVGYGIGVSFILAIKDRIHVFYYKLTKTEPTLNLTRALVIFSAITLHNMPEGMAVGVAFASGSITLGIEVALAIGIQNIPEGFAVAAPLFASGKFSKKKSFGFAVFSGLVEPVNAVLAYAVVSAVKGLLPYLFGFCAGAMMFVVVNEMIPEAQHGEYFEKSTVAILIGFLIMFVLDIALG